MQPSNDNDHPLRRADAALEELYRLRRELLAVDTTGRPLSWWRARRKALADFERVSVSVREGTTFSATRVPDRNDCVSAGWLPPAVAWKPDGPALR
jgi:hypothetical protein